MNFGRKKTMEKQRQLKSMGNKLSKKLVITAFKTFLFLILLVVVTGGFVAFGMFKGIIDNAPSVESVNITPSGYSTNIYDSKGKVIETLVQSGSNRVSVSIDEIPEYVQLAFVAIEDERFYEHNGIDLKGILRAGMVGLTSGHFSEGASTITQQLLKNNVFSDYLEEDTLADRFKRKFQEQYLALELEKICSKSEIMENYLNTINLGANTLGIQSAAVRYFNKDAAELSLSECAVIAAITQNPSANNPILYKENNAKRRDKILKNMKEAGYITQAEYDEAMADDVYSRIHKVNTQITDNTTPYSYFVDALIDQLAKDLQELKGYSSTQAYNALYSGGLSIYTTQDSQIQKICDEEISNSENYPANVKYSISWAWSVQHKNGEVQNFSEADILYYHKTTLGESNFRLLFNSEEEAKQCVKDYKKVFKKKGDKVLGNSLICTLQPQASFTVIDQKTGHVKAVCGGRGEKVVSRSLNRATNTKRQPGSCFKILTSYAPALDSGNYTLASTIVDSPFYYENGRAVKNHWGDTYRGPYSLRKGIRDSANVVTVKLLNELTPRVGYDMTCDFGITTLDPENDVTLPIALGGITDGVINLELCGAYAAIANDGVYTRPVLYTKVLDHNGRVLLESNPEENSHRVIKDSTAYLLTSAMHDVVTKGTGTKANVEDYYVAGKTGTTTNNVDIWFSGYTEYLTATIWAGYDENSQLTDTNFHNVLWSKIMTRIHEKKKYKSTEEWKMPESVVKAGSEYFAVGSEPTYYQSYDDDDYNGEDGDSGSWNEDESKEEETKDKEETTKKGSKKDDKKKDDDKEETTKKKDKKKDETKEETKAKDEDKTKADNKPKKDDAGDNEPEGDTKSEEE